VEKVLAMPEVLYHQQWMDKGVHWQLRSGIKVNRLYNSQPGFFTRIIIFYSKF
jgi:hypothetical protein